MIVMAFIGYFGDIVFECSEDKMLTPQKFEREGSSRWKDHDLLLRKPVSQFAGPSLEKISFTIILSAMHGINPETQLKALRDIRDRGIVLPLVLDSKPISDNYWRLDSVKEGNNIFDGSGWCFHSEVELSLTEYDDSNYIETQALSILSKVLL